MKAPKSYEEGMERLNAILAKMQDEQTTLAEAVKLYAEAASLMEYCHTALEKTSLQIEEIDAKITQTMQEQRFSMKFRKQFIAAEPPCVSGSKIDQIYLFRIRSPAFLLRFSPE